MQEVLMFNRNTREQRYLSAARHNEIEKLREDGWLYNPRLVQMHHPVLKKDVTVVTDERKEYENKGYYADPTMIYHPDGPQTKQVSLEDAKRAFKNGWYASPSEFPGNDIGKIKTANVMKEAS